MAAPPTSEAGIDALVLTDWYRQMMAIRTVEERLGQVSRAGELPGPVHLSVGQEAVAVGVSASLRKGDWATSTHRGHGHYIALGGDARLLVAEIYGRATGICGGKGGSMHVADLGVGMLGANGIVAAGIGLATGAALTAKTNHSQGVAVAFFGDGGANEGILLEALNLASVWKLPLIFVCENNGWSEFTPTAALTAGKIADRATPFGIPSEQVDGNDVVAVHRAATAAIERARRGDGPTLLEMMTYRLRGHVESEPTFLPRTYRSEDEVEGWRTLDPITQLRKRLEGLGTSAAELDAIDVAAGEHADAAFEFARESPMPDPATAFTDVFAGTTS
jgi:pyruvate dehydrogenase E1 component alpha subunit